MSDVQRPRFATPNNKGSVSRETSSNPTMERAAALAARVDQALNRADFSAVARRLGLALSSMLNLYKTTVGATPTVGDEALLADVQRASEILCALPRSRESGDIG